MRLDDIITESSFVSTVQAHAFCTLLLQCLNGSARAITKYMSFSHSDLYDRYYASVIDAYKAKDPDVINDLRDIGNDLRNDGHLAVDISKIKLIDLLHTIDNVISEKRDSNE